MKSQPFDSSVLSSDPCIHGIAQNCCSYCKSLAGDKYSTAMIKVFSPKTVRKHPLPPTQPNPTPKATSSS